VSDAAVRRAVAQAVIVVIVVIVVIAVAEAIGVTVVRAAIAVGVATRAGVAGRVDRDAAGLTDHAAPVALQGVGVGRARRQ
jgi:hypothetical protein